MHDTEQVGMHTPTQPRGIVCTAPHTHSQVRNTIKARKTKSVPSISGCDLVDDSPRPCHAYYTHLIPASTFHLIPCIHQSSLIAHTHADTYRRGRSPWAQGRCGRPAHRAPRPAGAPARSAARSDRHSCTRVQRQRRPEVSSIWLDEICHAQTQRKRMYIIFNALYIYSKS